MGRARKGGAGALVVQRAGSPGAMRVQQRRPRKDGWTQRRRARFLETLRATCNVRESARSVGLTHASAYELRKRDRDFARAWAEARDEAYAELEMMLLRHALFGSQRTETVRDGGGRHAPVKSVKTIHSYPHMVAVRLLIAHRKAVTAFREQEGRERPDDEAVIARVRAEMARIKERLSMPVPGMPVPGGSDMPVPGGSGGGAREGAGAAA